MKLLNFEIKVRNNLLLQKMRERGWSNAELSRQSNVPQTTIGLLLNLKFDPLNKKGAWRQPVLKICDALQCVPDDVFPEAMPVWLKNTVEITSNEMIGLESESTPEDDYEKNELSEAIAKMLKTLSPREERVMRMIWLDGMSKVEVAEVFDVGAERIRQIEQRSFRKLRHPCRTKKITDWVDENEI